MKKGKILVAVGAMILIVGVYVTAGAILPADETVDLTIPAGDWYYYLSYSGLIGGSIEVDYIVADGAVTIYVFDPEQFEEFQSTGSTDHLFMTSGDSGSFTFVMPDAGTYYFVLDHGTASGVLNQDVVWSTTINGTSIVGMVLGIVLISAGVVVVFIGLMIKKRDMQSAPMSPQTGVTFFQGQQQSPPGQV